VLTSPVGPKSPPPKVAPRGATVENGRYLVEYVTNCWACHTERSMKTGELVGPRFGGGRFEDEFEPEKRYWNAPNITSDKTGKTGEWGEEAFVRRDSMQLKGEGLIGFGRVPESGSSLTVKYVCEE